MIDKVGSLIGSMTYGAKKDTGLRLFQDALKLNFDSVIGMIEYANAMLMLEGDKMMADATRLYQQAASAKPMDATERLDVEMARVDRAKALLESSDWPLARIAERSGFGSLDGLHRAFQKRVSATPGEYRCRTAIQVRSPTYLSS